ncbi:hypothetical protein A7U60_g1699 [Sanghuangporus baumii]|uniref:RNA polymerase II-associated protein 1 C-terminal domain-containing protein n=1 Tax=Sanghuangporus baumii TaxID=108892 RepID=A0A9Q5I3J8_SANBA|nr:hypothetical protein A7U60_g1699 [Sanghuangporus baumii]
MPLPLPPPSLVGSVVERSQSSSSSSRTVSSPSPSGFPVVQHRSKSAFARAREAKRDGAKRVREVPLVRASGSLLSGMGDEEGDLVAGDVSAGPSKPSSSSGEHEEQWKMRMGRDNDRAVEAMSEEERERHVTEVLEQLGPNVGELLHKAREARTRTETRPDTHEGGRRDDAEEQHASNDATSERISQPRPTLPQHKTKLASPPRSILSQPTSRSSSPGRSARKLRFADVTPNDVHIYQSEPSSPRKPIGLLLPSSFEPEKKSGNTEKSSRPPRQNEEAEEGTPEDIRRRFFPDAPAKEPALEWIETKDASSDPEPRFDLSGAIIPASLRRSLPTHLGLHHHSGPSAAGYTLAELFLLARSSVPAQRSTILSVLSKLIRRLARRESEVSELNNRDSVRNQALVLGLAALTEKGTVGVQAVELVWMCVVYWDEDEVLGLDGVELRPLGAGVMQIDEENQSESPLQATDPISSLPFSALLPQIADSLESRSLPIESLVQLLSILHRFARHCVKIASAICETPRLIASVVNMFLLTPIPPAANGPLPNSLALDFLRTLALSSRGNARELEGPADALLRFITMAAPPSSSPFPPELIDDLLRGTLDLYATLARYGLYSGVVTTAAEHFNHLSSNTLRPFGGMSPELQISWLRLLSVWMVCACDPHRTIPPHDLLWSQVVGWTWGEDILEFRRNLLSSERDNSRLWAAVWDALASWLEGCRINSLAAGQDERDKLNKAVEQSWKSGAEKRILEETSSRLMEELSEVSSLGSEVGQRKDRFARIADLSLTLTSFSRLCVASLPKRVSGSDPQGSSSWMLDANALLESVVLTLLSSNTMAAIGRGIEKSRDDLSFRMEILRMRSTSTLLASYVKLTRSISGENDWLAFGLSGLQTLLPGDEDTVRWVIEEVISGGGPQMEFPEKLQFLLPFFNNMIRPDDGFRLSPLIPTPESIQKSTTQTLPADCAPRTSATTCVIGLPLSPDWPCIALDHLLRSGTSPILTNPDSVPDSWNASETDLVQASLSLMQHVQRSLSSGSFQKFSPSFAHVVFNCMKVFMLEHNQQQSDSNQEVFRDLSVGRLMDELLRPYTLLGSRSTSCPSGSDLEVVAKGFLGEGTPFFQFYTDFVALYDAISFSHTTFARLLLPPTSMSYAPDYRKLLWGDFGHTLRAIRTPIEDVPAVDIKQHFYPAETDAEILGWYLRALVKWPLDGFVRFVAVHHIACNIWPDLREGGEADSMREHRSQNLLVAIFNQAKADVVRDVVRYVQGNQSGFLLPPRCFAYDEEVKRTRLVFARSLGEERVIESIKKILAETG